MVNINAIRKIKLHTVTSHIDCHVATLLAMTAMQESQYSRGATLQFGFFLIIRCSFHSNAAGVTNKVRVEANNTP